MSNQQLKALEELEYKYLSQLADIFTSNLSVMLNNLSSHNDIASDWLDRWRTATKKSQGSMLATGIERVVYHVAGQFQGTPNSAPIASDLFFEVEDAFIHLDVKSVQTKNIGDINTKITISGNQTSYSGNIVVIKRLDTQVRKYVPSLPVIYSKKNKHCLTYFLTFLYEDKSPNQVLNINLICMPNGLLSDVYGSEILGAGKNPGNNRTGSGENDPKARFIFTKALEFKLLKSKKRIKVIYFDENMPDNYKKDLKDIEAIHML